MVPVGGRPSYHLNARQGRKRRCSAEKIQINETNETILCASMLWFGRNDLRDQFAKTSEECVRNRVHMPRRVSNAVCAHRLARVTTFPRTSQDDL